MGHWTLLDNLLQGRSAAASAEEDSPAGLAKYVELRLARYLNGLVGDVYQDVVLDLFRLFTDRVVSSSGENELMDVASLAAFQTGVLEALVECRV